MPIIKFVEHGGTEHVVDVPDGTSAMQAAVSNGVPGIDGDCGGICACATCHVYVDKDWVERTGGRGEQEHSMLTFSPILEDNSRLCCQITMRPELDGLVLHLPIGQH
ncbi:2Fe-2S iron-sulfur cluster-binding protein [Hydrogenophaga sp.]|uniref:2Fe-2S iron-sulfur cluster-binding protein n=1 Tax=Hydrogenophaga sp. TaxID=1904254 RepID=UPI002632C988|nr:2Fe-2S iron-sulfur cluster-binding protein [Hydrogenophaga sp.]MCW5653165.1 2Fe-2S iron-sulfur cluster binding domain-containing protein [Hydrogenophaga sp.]